VSSSTPFKQSFSIIATAIVWLIDIVASFVRYFGNSMEMDLFPSQSAHDRTDVITAVKSSKMPNHISDPEEPVVISGVVDKAVKRLSSMASGSGIADKSIASPLSVFEMFGRKK
jgi:hypothetical protein